LGSGRAPSEYTAESRNETFVVSRSSDRDPQVRGRKPFKVGAGAGEYAFEVDQIGPDGLWTHTGRKFQEQKIRCRGIGVDASVSEQRSKVVSPGCISHTEFLLKGRVCECG